MFLRWPDGPVAPTATASVRAHGPRAKARSDDPGLADNAALEGEHPGLALAQRARITSKPLIVA